MFILTDTRLDFVLQMLTQAGLQTRKFFHRLVSRISGVSRILFR